MGEGQQKFLNGASKSNRGWELSLGYRNSTTAGLTYSISGNAGHFHDEITKLPEDVRAAYPGNVEQTILGHSQFSFFGYQTEGIFQTQDAVTKHAQQPGAGVGRLMYKDNNNDGVIDASDQTWIGTSLPSLDYGLRVNFEYKNFDLTVFGSGVAGKKGFDPSKFANAFIDTRNNYLSGVFDGWTPQNTGSKSPALSILNPNGEDRTSDFFIVNASYFKLRNVQLGYTLPRSVIRNLKMESWRFYVLGQNLFALKSKEFAKVSPLVKKADGTDPSNYRISTYTPGGNVPAWDQQTAFTALQWERRMEFAMEGSRFFDLVRWGIAAETLNAYFAVEKVRHPFLNNAKFTKGTHEYLPIPQQEIQFTNGVYAQNNGYH